MRAGVRGGPRSQQGMALAIVVWFIAGMSLLVGGIVTHARIDTKMAQAHVARAKAVAAGDGAIRMQLARGLAGPRRGEQDVNLLLGEHRLGELRVTVQLYPTTGLIGLNSASSEMLAALFEVVGQLPPDEANALAGDVVKWREGASLTGNNNGPKRFNTVEDLLRVEGMRRTLLDAVRDYVVAGNLAGRAVDWSVAPPGLLPVLARAAPDRVSAAQRRRDAAQESTGASLSGSYRADALVSYGGKQWLRRLWVSPGNGNGAFDWRVVRAEPARVRPG